MRFRALLIAVSCLIAPAAARAQIVCNGGQFDIAGAPLVIIGPANADSMLLGTSALALPMKGYASISTTEGCPVASAKVRARRDGMRVQIAWPSCGSIAGPHRLSATIDATCNSMIGTVRTRHVRGKRTFAATRHTQATAPQDTFTVIQERIFGSHGCNVSTCHGPFGQANLDLRAGASYAQLIDVPAVNAAAAAAGKKRVAPGDAAASFLSQKLHGTLGQDEGSRMPLVGNVLSQLELDLVDAWINAGAPSTGIVPGAPTLPPNVYVPADPLPVPSGGYQVVLNGPTLQPGEEQEGCFWIPTPNATDFNVSRWEYSLNPGTHHFALYLNRIANPPLNTWLAGDFGCFNEATYGASITGAPQSPYYVDSYPAGVARVLPAGRYLGLNAHYRNDFTVPIQMKVWVNIHPYAGSPDHTAQGLTSLDTTFGISVPPFTQKLQHGRFVNTTGLPMSFITISGHMHKRGLRFTAYRSDGSKLYDNYDWAHPLNVVYQPPFVLAPNDWIDYECLHDNGVTRPLKRDSLGNPTTLVFGVTTDDEMCILPGTYYTD